MSPDQLAVGGSALTAKLFLHGRAGTGKSTAGVGRLNYLLANGVPGDAILVLTPQRTLQEPYFEVIRSPERLAGGDISPATVGGLARRMTELFWPLAAEQAGFSDPDRPPVFLTLETAQYYMAHLVRPLLEQGYFEPVTIDRNRLYSQILDNLNKSAAVGFPFGEIGARLDSAWMGDPAQRRVFTDVQECARRFREFCLEHNLLDFSLQLQVFWDLLWPDPAVRAHLTQTYRHLIYDNLEEDIPRAHDLLREWLPEFESALLIYDEGGGYRRFLGADVETALALRELCTEQVEFSEPRVASPEIALLGEALGNAIDPARFPVPAMGLENVSEPLKLILARFYPEMIDAIVAEIERLGGEEQLPPSEIVILAPYLSDALRFSITSRLEARGLPWRTHRPSRSLRDEPAAQALLTLASLAHPYWGRRPSKFDLAYALMLALDTDLVRAQLLAEIVYRTKEFTLSAFEQINAAMQERVTFLTGSRFTVLRQWILDYRGGGGLPFDHFLRRFFGEVLSQPGFGFHRNLDAARVAANLIESVHKFRLAMEPSLVGLDHVDFDFGREYIAMLQEGVISAQYLESWRVDKAEAILVAPAFTFLMMNRPARVEPHVSWPASKVQ